MKRLKINTKVVPHSKSVGRTLRESAVWANAQMEDQPFLYVRSVLIEGERYVYVLHNKKAAKDAPRSGDYFYREDFDLYVEPTKNQKAKTDEQA